MSTDKSAIDQWQSAFGGSSPTEEPLSPATEDSDDVVRAEQSTVDDVPLGETEDTQEDSPETQEAAEASSKPEAKPEISDKEVIAVTDETGRKRKIEIDYSNREAIKKTYAMAAGMRKFQAERDQAIQSSKTKDTELNEYKSNWKSLEDAYKGGTEGLVDLLEGRKGAFKELVKREVEKARFLETASPDEMRAFQKQEEADKLRSEYDRLRKDNEKFKEEVRSREESAEVKALEGRVYPAFEKYSFSEKLGDAHDEQLFNEMLWTTATRNLKPYEEQGLELTPELVDREFKAVATRLRGRINAQAEKKVSKVIEQKKQEATENVQSKVKSSYNKSTDEDKLRAHLKDGNTDAIFKNWSSFAKILGNRK